MGPKVSVVIPTYKRNRDFLKRAIDSVLAQTYENVEIVVIDDNIPDSNFRKDTETFMKFYANESKVVYIKNETNMGGALARNKGITQSQGGYITFLDDDDIYLPKKIERQLDYMISKNYDMTFTDLKIHNTKDVLIDYREFKFIKDFSNDSLLKTHIMRHITGTPTFMYKRDSLTKIGGFLDSKMGQEFYLMLKTIENKLNIGYLPFSDVVAYVHEGERISNGSNKLDGENKLFEFKKKYFNRFKFREKMFIRFRHHVVMAVAGLRSRMFFICIKHTFLAVVFSPIDAIIEPINYIKKVSTYKSSAYTNN
ncbi:glycosyltransferase family 2 protein [Priestia megaterium]|uniref:glycosyltransferase family 2 protein n=1 Tax=Priestia megaterium TaxID=1404 RepID=UPI002795A34A|nr:glycosyltransferase family 2 protein [Priestia megaterium]